MDWDPGENLVMVHSYIVDDEGNQADVLDFSAEDVWLHS